MTGHKLAAETANWTSRRCVPCEGGVPTIGGVQAKVFCEDLAGWNVDESEKSISRKINCGGFTSAVKAIQQIAEVADQEQHHPDLHLTGYRHLRIVMTTHAIGGLSENDFVLAAKINQRLATAPTARVETNVGD